MGGQVWGPVAKKGHGWTRRVMGGDGEGGWVAKLGYEWLRRGYGWINRGMGG